MRLVATIIALAILAGGLLLATILAADRDIGAGRALFILFIVAFLDGAWWLVAMLLMGPYYQSLRYEIQDDEVVVHAGIWTKSVKHVPYRTVTNLTVKRDVIDRWLGLGTLNIQTAGMSGQTGAEEHLVGLADVQEVYDTVATELRRFRGGMAPTQAEVEEAIMPAQPDALNELLVEVRAIRRSLESHD
jgi:putative membrane protein